MDNSDTANDLLEFGFKEQIMKTYSNLLEHIYGYVITIKYSPDFFEK